MLLTANTKNWYDKAANIAKLAHKMEQLKEEVIKAGLLKRKNTIKSWIP